ncbi:MAG: type IV secretory system conjugative DNA transfer family protein [Arcanobacterium sp.]
MTAKRVFTIIFMALVWWAGDLISYQVRTDHEAGRSFSEILDRVFQAFHNPFAISLHRTDMLVGVVCVGVVGLVWLYHHVGQGTRRQGEEHGSARWGTARDIRRFIDKAYNNNVVFTTTERLSLDGRKTQRNINALVIGGSGSGKSRYFVQPNLAQANTSYLVTDPKGELYAMTADYLRGKGYVVRCLNLVDFDQSETFNPLAYFNEAQPEVDVTILVKNFISNTNGEKPKNAGDFWEKAESALLHALIAYVYFTKGSVGTLIDVVDLLAKMQASEQNEAMKSDVDYLFDAVAELINDYDTAENKDEWGTEAVAAVEGLRFASSQYTTYTQGAGETKKSVIISLGVRMSPLHMSPIRALLSSDSIGMDQVGMEKTAMFLIIPDTHAAFSFLVSIFYEMFFEKSIYTADHLEARRLPYPVQCYMDEFANIGKMPSFERKIAVMRSRGISTAVIVQNFSQGKALYKDDWETIVGNCDSFLFLGGSEKSTTEYVSKLVGKQTIASTDISESRGRNGSWTMQNRSLGRDLISPDEVARLDGNECIYVLRGLPPFKSRKLKHVDL